MNDETKTGVETAPASPQAEHTGAAPAERCDMCGAAMRPMGHCKYWCLRCGFLMTCHDRF